jgi:hypothetical protein
VYSHRRIADVAQTVEQLIRNQQVSGSIPLIGSRINKGLTSKWLAPFSLSGHFYRSFTALEISGHKKPRP